MNFHLCVCVCVCDTRSHALGGEGSALKYIHFNMHSTCFLCWHRKLWFTHEFVTGIHVYYVLCMLKFSPREQLSPISPPALVGKYFITLIHLFCKDCIEDMATYTVLAEVVSTKSSCNTSTVN
jgi:hypothetical protein